MIHPQARAYVATLRAAGAIPFHALTPTEARAVRTARPAPPAPASPVFVTEHTLPGPGGPLRVLRYAPAHDTPPGPAILYLHSGGWVLGTIEPDDPVCAALVEHTGRCVFALDYRLAPEHPFPAALDDTLATVRWLMTHAGELGFVSDHLALLGVSAGGTLAAAVSAILCDTSTPIRAQVLVYPPLDATRSAASHREDFGDVIVDEETMEWFYGHYLPERQALDDPRLSPLHAPGFRSLPPSLVVVAGYDPLRDEGLAYAKALETAGVDVTLRAYPDMIHGFFVALGSIDAAHDALRVATTWLTERV